MLCGSLKEHDVLFKYSFSQNNMIFKIQNGVCIHHIGKKKAPISVKKENRLNTNYGKIRGKIDLLK
jgi:hypothetical protein